MSDGKYGGRNDGMCNNLSRMIKMAIGCREEIGPPDWIVKQVQWNENYSAMSSAMIPPVVYEPASLPSGCRIGRTIGRSGETTASSGEQKNSTKTPSATNPSISFSEGMEQSIYDVHTGDTLESEEGGEVDSLLNTDERELKQSKFFRHRM